MKKFVLLALTLATTLSVSAEGYQVNTLSAKQFGMGHTGVSQKLNSESLWFNPSAAAYQEKKFSFSAGVTAIKSIADYSSLPYSEYVDGAATGKYDYSKVSNYTSTNDISTPLFFSANYKVNNDLSVGLSFNTPFGSSMSWEDDWAGAHLVQGIKLSSYTLQPTVSYKFLDDKLSFGVGFMMSWGNFELSRSILPVTENTPLMASATLSGDAGVKLGFNAGVMYDINERWSIGASYRSKIEMEVDAGNAIVNYADPTYAAIPELGVLKGMETGSFSAALPLPAQFSFGVSFRPTERWELVAELQHVQWNTYDRLVVNFNESELAGFNTDAVKDYSNTMIVRFGGQYKANDWLKVRLGMYVDESPVASMYLNPETPSMTKVGYTSGLSIAPFASNRDFSIDLAYGYITSADPERIGSYPTEFGTFFGQYSTKAHVMSIGVSCAF